LKHDESQTLTATVIAPLWVVRSCTHLALLSLWICRYCHSSWFTIHLRQTLFLHWFGCTQFWRLVSCWQTRVHKK